MTDIKLDPKTHDIVIEDDLMMFGNSEEEKVLDTIQRVKMRLLLYKGEWFRDVGVGVPYIQEILGRRDAKNVADANIKNTILATENIQSLTSYTSHIDPKTREFKVIFSGFTETGDLLDNIEVRI